MTDVKIILKYRKTIERMCNIKLKYFVISGQCYEVVE